MNNSNSYNVIYILPHAPIENKKYWKGLNDKFAVCSCELQKLCQVTVHCRFCITKANIFHEEFNKCNNLTNKLFVIFHYTKKTVHKMKHVLTDIVYDFPVPSFYSVLSWHYLLLLSLPLLHVEPIISPRSASHQWVLIQLDFSKELTFFTALFTHPKQY